MSALAKDVNALAAQPSFAKYATLYGPTIKHPQSVRGKKLLIMAGTPGAL